MSNSAEAGQSTYQYRKPFHFMGKEYRDSRNLAYAFADNWDIALSVFRRGSMENFWEEYVQAEEERASEIAAASAFFHEAYGKMWDGYNEDAVFQAVLYYIEPALNAIPILLADSDTAKLLTFEEFGEKLYIDSRIYEADAYYDEDRSKLRAREGTEDFSELAWQNRFYLEAAKNQVFSTYQPQLREVEERFVETGAKDGPDVLRELGVRFSYPTSFLYHGCRIQNMQEFASLMHGKEASGKISELVSEWRENPGRLLQELFEMRRYREPFEKWVAEVDEGRFYENSKELEKKWLELNKLAAEEGYERDTLFEGCRYIDEGGKSPVCDDFIGRCPVEAAEIKPFLESEIETAKDYITAVNESVNKAVRWHQAVKAVLTGIVETGLMNREDMEQDQPWKNCEAIPDRIEEVQKLLDAVQTYGTRLKDALSHYKKNCLPQGWDGADREERTMLLTLGWYPATDGESDQRNALLDKLAETWRRDQDISLLVDAGSILLSHLKRRLSGVCPEDMDKMKSVFADCPDWLILYDRVSELCDTEEKDRELKENWDKMCNLIFHDRAKPALENIFSEFEEKYRQNEETAVNTVKRGECFGGISYGENNTVSVAYVQPNEAKYPAPVYELIEEICRNSSDYMSNYRQQMDNFSSELSVILEEGCHYGKLSVDLKKWMDFISDLSDVKETLSKNSAEITSLIEDADKQMVQADDERARREEEEQRRKKEKEEEEQRKKKEKEEEERRKKKEKEEEERRRKKEKEEEERRIKQKKEQKRQKRKRFRKKYGAYLIIMGFIIALVIATAVTYYDRTQPSRELYASANALMSEGNYVEAAEQFSQLGDYEDSQEKAILCRYAEAEQLYDRGEYIEAAAIFRELGNYNDSDSRETDSVYMMAVKEYDQGAYESAYEMFQKMGDYKDSEEYMADCISASRMYCWDFSQGEEEVGGLITEKHGDVRMVTLDSGMTAAAFDGDGDYISCGTDLNLPENYTFNVILCCQDVDREYSAFFAKYENEGGSYSYSVNQGHINCRITDTDGNLQEIQTESSVNNGEWCMITIVKSGTSFKIFKDGILDAEGEVNAAGAGEDMVTIGRQALLSDPEDQAQFAGYIESIAIYNIALTSDTISSMADATLASDGIRYSSADSVLWNGHAYAVYANCDTWEDAQAYCESIGGHLATISSDEENAFLYSYIISQGYNNAYFGLADNLEEGTWYWVNGEELSYTNWHPKEPNGESAAEDYAMFYSKYSDGTWNDGNFSGKGSDAFICEWE